MVKVATGLVVLVRILDFRVVMAAPTPVLMNCAVWQLDRVGGKSQLFVFNCFHIFWHMRHIVP